MQHRGARKRVWCWLNLSAHDFSPRKTGNRMRVGKPASTSPARCESNVADIQG
jgi:hypothetical protein